MDLKGAEIRNFENLCNDMSTKKELPLRVNIPFYQRPYRWDEVRISTLVEDYFQNLNNNNSSEYFVGSVVLVKGKNDRYDIVDGQQRITTVFLLSYLKFLLLRAYIDELISCNRTSKVSRLVGELKVCYLNFIGEKHSDDFTKLQTIEKNFDKINDSSEKEKEKRLDETLRQYETIVGLPYRKFENESEYNEYYSAELYDFLNEQLSLIYDRKHYNELLQKALSYVIITVSKDFGVHFNVNYDGNEPIISQYTKAINVEFDKIKSKTDYSKCEDYLDRVQAMIDTINSMISNLKFCVIITDNTKDAYTLFEVLNDRALEIDDLDLIKNLYYKKYCMTTSESEDIIDKNIEELDKLWGDEVFTSGLGSIRSKLISYLGAVYLTGLGNLSNKVTDKYRDDIDKKYLVKYNNSNPYKFEYIKRDFQIYQMIATIISEYDLQIRKKASCVYKAESCNEYSITYKVLHLLNALNQDGVLSAMINIILKSYMNCKKEIKIIEFKAYLSDLKLKSNHNEEKFYSINKWALKLWKVVLLAKDANIPREIAKRIICKVNNDDDFIDDVYIKDEEKHMLKKQFCEWIDNWVYGNENSNLKAKVLFINIYMLDLSKSKDKLVSTATYTSFSFPEHIQLDHLEPLNISQYSKEKYFQPSNNGDRNQIINGIGNMMVLDSEGNNNKSETPLCEFLDEYKTINRNHWLVKEIENLLHDDNYSEKVNNSELCRKPNDKFFFERRKRLKTYFLSVLNLEKSLDLNVLKYIVIDLYN